MSLCVYSNSNKLTAIELKGWQEFEHKGHIILYDRVFSKEFIFELFEEEVFYKNLTLRII